MQLTYDGVALHELGDLILVPSFSFEPAENPQRKVVRLSVVVDIDTDNYHEGKTKWWGLLSALQGKQHAELIWVNPSAPGGQQTYFQAKSATCASVDLPDDPNGWGTYYQQVRLVFSWQERLTDTEAQNMTVRFTGAGGSEQALGNISSWKESYQNEYYDEDRDARRRSGGRVQLSGSFTAAATDPLATRRAALFTVKDAMVAEVNRAIGTLVYRKVDGSPQWSQVVKVDQFQAQVDQARDRIDWQMEVHFTQYPNMADFGRAEFDVSERETREEGQLQVTFSGSVDAPDEIEAHAKLDAIRAVALTGYSTKIQIQREHTPSFRDAGEDGRQFHQLRFSESYRVFQVQAAAIHSVRFTHVKRKDWVNLTQRVSYRGEVFGSHGLLMDCVNEVSGNFLAKFLAALGATGTIQNWEVSAPREYVPSAFVDNTASLSTPIADRVQAISFTVDYEDALTDGDQILSCDVNESVQYSGTRYVSHAMPDAANVIQASGIEPGSRSVTGSVKAASYAAAWNYAVSKQSLLTGWAADGSVPPVGVIYHAPNPPKVDVNYVFDMRVEGIADADREGETANVRVYEARFTFGEILANYPMPGLLS